MPSELIVKIQKIFELRKHPQADRLDIAIIGQVGGWPTCVKKDEFKVGDLVVYFPPDCLLSKSLHEFLGITNYCSELPKDSAEYTEGYRRVRAANLRGEKSFGTIMPIDDLPKYYYANNPPGSLLPMYLGEGVDVTDLLKVRKFTPKEKCLDGDAEKPANFFHHYTDIQNYRNYPEVFNDGEPIVCLEKIHGCLKDDTLVLMSDGSEKLIQDIVKEDVVVSYNELTKEFVSSKVIGLKTQDITDKLEWYKLEFDNGRSIVCTEDHPFLTTEGWIIAKNLTENHIFL